MRGLFITFEGPDGSGKSTQLQRMASYLNAQLYDVLTTREPGGTAISDQIRRIVLDPEHPEMAEQTEVLLYAASRAQHVQEKIKPALEQGKMVLCDRFVDASIAYQGFGLGFGEQTVQQINDFATGGLTPDRTYMIDVAPELSRERMNTRTTQEFTQELDRIEQKELEYHARVRQGFQTLAKQHQRIMLIDGNQSIESIHQLIVQDLLNLIKARTDSHS
ncbi:dTMP kinase [Bacillus horti]|uniref:Thymidylate kinase n=1 Tax=Caldalkalibacillus horti TaxID=77523 RepID=A0ABT9W2S6_9BACI|nr:dTMP kinase [Bacillus horti]MDQ0167556.1 dTMP kinase [Bacillus horti]